jgi:hypothetical protein
MSRFLFALPLLVACGPDVGVIDVDDDAVTNPDEFSEYDGARLRIVEPASASFLALEASHHFRAELLSAEGTPLDFDEIVWTSTANTEWTRTGVDFDDEDLGVGIHDITAEVSLPNGDRLAHTVGGVLVQSIYAGTYAGLISADVTYDTYTFTCAGNAVIVIDAWGEKGTGEASCLLSFSGYDMESIYTFDLDNDEGELSGSANADIGGWFEYPFDAEGSVDPDSEALDLGFGGDMGGYATIDATVASTRISLDSGLE